MDKPFMREPKREPRGGASTKEPWEERYDAWLVAGVLFLLVLTLSVLRINH